MAAAAGLDARLRRVLEETFGRTTPWGPAPDESDDVEDEEEGEEQGELDGLVLAVQSRYEYLVLDGKGLIDRSVREAGPNPCTLVEPYDDEEALEPWDVAYAVGALLENSTDHRAGGQPPAELRIPELQLLGGILVVYWLDEDTPPDRWKTTRESLFFNVSEADRQVTHLYLTRG